MSHYEKLRQKFSSNKEDFILKANIVHNNQYNYSKVEYLNNKTKVIITCLLHGDFIQRPDNHIHLKQGCPECKKINQSLRQTKKSDDFIKESIKLYGNKYSYDDLIYIRNNKPVKIYCKKHGYFRQRPNDHLSGKEGCRKCHNSGTSKLEIEISDFVSKYVNVINNTKMPLGALELDIYIPDLNKAIEVNGKYWHYIRKERGYHSYKSNLCKSKGIKLLHLREDLWSRDKERMKKVILKFLEKE